MKSKSSLFNILAYLVLLVLAIPWYWSGEEHPFLLGVPAWVLVALVVALATSILTAWNFLKGEDEED